MKSANSQKGRAMSKPQKRDRVYYEERFQQEFPAIYGNLLAGRCASVNAAAIAAGLVKSPTPLDRLKRAWRNVSTAEQKEFIKWARRPDGKHHRGSDLT